MSFQNTSCTSAMVSDHEWQIKHWLCLEPSDNGWINAHIHHMSGRVDFNQSYYRTQKYNVRTMHKNNILLWRHQEYIYIKLKVVDFNMFCKCAGNVTICRWWLWGLNIFYQLKFHLTSSDSFAGLNVGIFHWLVCWAGLHLYTVWLNSFIVDTLLIRRWRTALFVVALGA